MDALIEQNQALQTALSAFLRRCDASSTRVAYERELRRFLAWLGSLAPGVLDDYVSHLRERGLGPTTVRWRAVIASSFLSFAHRRGFLNQDVTSDFSPPKGVSGFAPRVLSAKELRRLLRAPDRRSHKGKRDLAVLVCLGIGGLRAGEVCRLTVGDVEFQVDEVVLRVNGKGRKKRMVRFAEPWAEAFRAYWRIRPGARESESSFFLSHLRSRNPGGLTTPGVDYLLRGYAGRVRLNGIGAHTLRHTAASLALHGGAALHEVRDLLGHASVLTTSLYLHVAVAERPATAYALSGGDPLLPQVSGSQN